jgi:hypothetical protein
MKRALRLVVSAESTLQRGVTACLAGLGRLRNRLHQTAYVVKNRSSVLLEVPVAACIGPLGFSFGHEGWHHLLDLLREYDQDPSLCPEESALSRFYERYQPSSMAELLEHTGYVPQFRPAFFEYPWGNFRLDYDPEISKKKNQERSRFCGPASEWRLHSDFDQTIRLYKQIRRTGYRPWRYGFIGGVLLRRANGEERFVVLEGNHRLAVLARLGAKRVWVSFLEGFYHVLSESDVDQWYFVRTGACTVADALAYFNAFFELDGRERLVKLRLREAAVPPERKRRCDQTER